MKAKNGVEITLRLKKMLVSGFFRRRGPNGETLNLPHGLYGKSQIKIDEY